MFRWLRVTLAVAVLGAILAGAPIGAQADVPFRVTVAKDKDGPYVLTLPVVTIKGAPKDFYFRVASKSDQDLDMKIEDASFGADIGDFKVRWFKGNMDISHDAQTNGYLFTLHPGDKKVFRGLVKPLVAHPGKMCLAPIFTELPNVYQVAGSVYINDGGVCG